MLVVLNEEFLERTIRNLNFDKVNLVMIIKDTADEKVFKVGKEEIPVNFFSRIYLYAREYRDCIWLISGYVNGIADLDAIKNFLTAYGLPEENIFNFEIDSQISETWFANLHYIEARGADFFATGNADMQVGLNFNYIPCVYKNRSRALGGVNLCDVNQDLQQGYLTARYVFQKVKRGTIKFVLIGLSPYSFHYDSFKKFSASSKNLQYMSLFTLNFVSLDIQKDAQKPQYLSAFNYPYPNAYTRLLEDLVSNKVKNIFDMTVAETDTNFDALREELGGNR